MKKIIADHKGQLILSSLVTLLPALAGWWLAHWLVLLITFSDRRNRENQSRKAVRLIFWIMPAVSLLTGGVTALLQRGVQSASTLSTAMAMGFGLLFIVLGNYMPKFRQNSFMGIRVKWTLESEANWNATHRMGGKVWVAGGFACLAGAMLPVKAMGAVFPVVLVTVALAPIVYSYYYSKTQPAAEKTVSAPLPLWQKRAARLIVAAVAVIAVWVFLAGSAKIVYEDASFTVEASGWQDLTLSDPLLQRHRRSGLPARGGGPGGRHPHLWPWQPAGVVRPLLQRSLRRLHPLHLRFLPGLRPSDHCRRAHRPAKRPRPGRHPGHLRPAEGADGALRPEQDRTVLIKTGSRWPDK